MVLKIFILGLVLNCLSCSSDASIEPLENKPFTEKDAVNLYTVKCSSCHGSDGKLGLSGAKDLSMSKLSDDQILQTIKMGKNVMPSFEGSISNEQMKMLIPVVKSLRK